MTEHKIFTLMHDPQYRTAIAWQNIAYKSATTSKFLYWREYG